MSLDSQTTRLLQAWQRGERDAGELLSARVYEELRAMARSRLAAEPAAQTLQPTALVNEVYLRLLQGRGELRDRAHFFATAALHMRSILVDHARARLADKRGGSLVRVTLDDRVSGASEADADLLALDAALAALQQADARAARVVELTYFGGLSREEIAEAMGLSVPTVDRALRFGRVWLKRALAA